MNLEFWTNLSIVWLALLAFIMGIVPLVLFYFLVRGMMIVNRTVPRYLKLGQYYSGIARDQTRKGAEKAVEPVVRVYGQTARADAIARGLLPRPSSTSATKKENQP